MKATRKHYTILFLLIIFTSCAPGGAKKNKSSFINFNNDPQSEDNSPSTTNQSENEDNTVTQTPIDEALLLEIEEPVEIINYLNESISEDFISHEMTYCTPSDETCYQTHTTDQMIIYTEIVNQDVNSDCTEGVNWELNKDRTSLTVSEGCSGDFKIYTLSKDSSLVGEATLEHGDEKTFDFNILKALENECESYDCLFLSNLELPPEQVVTLSDQAPIFESQEEDHSSLYAMLREYELTPRTLSISIMTNFDHTLHDNSYVSPIIHLIDRNGQIKKSIQLCKQDSCKDQRSQVITIETLGISKILISQIGINNLLSLRSQELTL